MRGITCQHLLPQHCYLDSVHCNLKLFLVISPVAVSLDSVHCNLKLFLVISTRGSYTDWSLAVVQDGVSICVRVAAL
jgi:hypothetical protein